ncbi:hypothetical protein MHW47_05905 [Streptomyces sp. OfavH-34-F]|uniref:hypothetical protein n=1 Tax=Streptomyces sp. OfavH-34-F TaxID=2917760 RepID=UPI001EF372A4|nr:hypothetical protein [Streptomyces sp. OfavH-34-F]MCG7523975.1 hypothetical protein [Streptomyces sp. OfavH-34-F]
MLKPAPNSVAAPRDAAHLSAAPAPPLGVDRLDAEIFTAAAMELATAHWSLEQLTSAASTLTAECARRRETMLADVLRALFHVPQADGGPVTRVEFVTDSPYENGTFWDESQVYLHYKDGTVTEFEDFTENGDADTGYKLLDDAFRELLTDIAADTPPQPGDHLIVDLATGEFERSGKWAM